MRDCVLPDTREVEDVLGAAFFQDDESAIALDGAREGLGADDARAVRQDIECVGSFPACWKVNLNGECDVVCDGLELVLVFVKLFFRSELCS